MSRSSRRSSDNLPDEYSVDLTGTRTLVMMDLAFDSILHLVRVRTGWELRDEVGSRLRERLSVRLTALQEAPAQYLQRLESDPRGPEWSALLALLSNPETFFFRDSRQIALLKEHLLPELLERRRAQRSLRLWSAGCSTGEEAYSLAFLLQELAPDLASWDVLILGTDVNPQAIEKAREGVYREWSFRGRRAALDRYFNREGDGWRVKDHLRRLTTFRQGNLVEERFPDVRTEIRELDLIICRNVFIYFSRDAVSGVVAKMAAALRDGGFLLTGHAELHGVELAQLPLQARRLAGSLVHQLGPPHFAPQRAAGSPTPRSRPAAASGLTSKPRIARVSTRPNPPGSPATANPTPPGYAAPISAEQLLADGQYGAALEQTRERLLAAPGDLATLATAVRAAANTGDHEWAAAACRAALERLPFAPEPYYFLAQLAEELGRLAEAKAWLKKCLYVTPQYVPAYLELASIYERERNPTRAAKLRVEALELLRAMPADVAVTGCGDDLAGELTAQLAGALGWEERPE